MVTLLGVVLVATACGQSQPRYLGDSLNSGIEDIPVPETAKPHSSADGVWVVPRASFRRLVEWYEVRLPLGNNWVPEASRKVWSWCERRTGPFFAQWVYERSTDRQLVIEIVAGDLSLIQITVQPGTCGHGAYS